ncbi:dehydrogenase/reductase SDR family member 1-like [Haliotis cracherodii]|uniref:dehydrogenase/reductase SDR family member 1-like n=1 Tax=Haliotis cracherodii TaxID=6455 RepID=UPI0039EBC8C4
MLTMKTLAGKVCIVTGATRGIGRGIALQLGEAGATVYITGRTLTTPKDADVAGSLTDTATEVKARGGKCIPVQCDHSKDEDVKKLFERVAREQEGQLDVLVNNAYAAVNDIAKNFNVPFWEQAEDMWDQVNNVGLRNHYICSVLASRMMVPRKQGLIINVSSIGGLSYLFNVPYGVGKEACDRMAKDCSVELKKHNVAYASLWPGAVKTETVTRYLDEESMFSKFQETFKNGETVEYAGKCVVSLATDSNIMKKTGRILISTDLGYEYGFVDIDGKTPPNPRQIKFLVAYSGASWLAGIIPGFLKIPLWVLALMGNKF